MAASDGEVTLIGATVKPDACDTLLLLCVGYPSRSCGLLAYDNSLRFEPAACCVFRRTSVPLACAYYLRNRGRVVFEPNNIELGTYGA